MIGNHLISHWCKLQDRITLSSGEAELYSGVRGLSEGTSLLELTRDMEPHKGHEIEHSVDAVACRDILLRHGTGQLKHLETNTLWTKNVSTNTLSE